MTNPYPFVKIVRRDQLAQECRSAFGAALVTVRVSGNASGEVIHDGTLTDAQIQAVIDAHVPQETNDEKIAKPGVALVITALANHTGTVAERLSRIESALAWVLLDRRRQQAGDLS